MANKTTDQPLTIGGHVPGREQFLSEEDLDLKNLSEDELIAYWNMWLKIAQSTNEQDKDSYSHGVFGWEPGQIRFL